MTSKKTIAVPTAHIHAVDIMPEETLAEIGKLILKWGYIQFQLGVIVREIAKIPNKETGRVITHRAGINQLCDMIEIFCKTNHWINDTTLRADINKLIGSVRKSNENNERNKYAHCIVTYDDKLGSIV